jgi:hypothetical protein
VLVGCAYFAVTRRMVIVLRSDIKALRLTSGLDVSQMLSAMRWRAKRMPAARLTWRGGKRECVERCQRLLYRTAEDLVATTSGLAGCVFVLSIVKVVVYNKYVAGQPEAEGGQHTDGRMTFCDLHVTVGRSEGPTALSRIMTL